MAAAVSTDAAHTQQSIRPDRNDRSAGAPLPVWPVGDRRWQTRLREQLHRAGLHSIGYPVATDVDYTRLSRFHHQLINNIGDPESRGRWSGHVKDLELDVVSTFAHLFGGDRATTWGYVTGGGSSEGVLHGLWLALEAHPHARVYLSRAAHYCVAKAVRLTRAEHAVIPADRTGEIDYGRLAAAVAAHPGRAAVVIATAGTTMTEAIDHPTRIHSALDEAGNTDRFVVLDAALAGPALALDAAAGMDAVLGEHSHGVDHVCFSAHKSFGTPHVGGVSLTRRRHARRLSVAVDYLGGRDATVAGSRSGQVSIELAHALDTLGLDGLRARAARAQQIADHTVARLRGIGWLAWRFPHAWTVVLDPAPPELVAARWSLPVSQGIAHLVCAPGVTTTVIDRFVDDLDDHTSHTGLVDLADRPPSRPVVPAPSPAPAIEELPK